MNTTTTQTTQVEHAAATPNAVLFVPRVQEVGASIGKQTLTDESSSTSV